MTRLLRFLAVWLPAALVLVGASVATAREVVATLTIANPQVFIVESSGQVPVAAGLVRFSTRGRYAYDDPDGVPALGSTIVASIPGLPDFEIDDGAVLAMADANGTDGILQFSWLAGEPRAMQRVFARGSSVHGYRFVESLGPQLLPAQTGDATSAPAFVTATLRDGRAIRILANDLGTFEVAVNEVTTVTRLSGDRQILVGDADAAPYRLQVRDAHGAPIAAAFWTAFPNAFAYPTCPRYADEFGFRGFNVSDVSTCPTLVGVPPQSLLAGTDANGIVNATPTLPFDTPSAFPIAALLSEASVNGEPSTRIPPILFTTVRVATAPAPHASVVVEYVSPQRGHYFNTLLQDEIDLLDAGRFPDWTRSIGGFIAWEKAADAPAGSVPVCRFFSERYTSHFYTADAAECDTVVQRWPDVWTLETRAAFYIFTPDRGTGACGPQRQPIYRLFNAKPIPNHRYVTDAKLRDAMVAAGWVAEGYGPDAVMMCTPS